MTVFALLSDLHVAAGARWEEGRRVHAAALEKIRERRPDGILIGGDFHDRRTLPEERVEGGELLLNLATVAPVVGIYGNHDAPADLHLYNHIGRPGARPIRFYDTPDVHVLGDTAILALPWDRTPPNPAHIRLPEAARAAAESEARARLLAELADRLDATGAATKLVLSHVMLREAQPGIGQPEIRGGEFVLSLADLAVLRAHGYLLGHVHKGQDWTIGAAPVVYPGSTHRRTYGELERKYMAFVHCDGPRVSVEFEELPATPMMLVETKWEEQEPGRWGFSVPLADLLADAAGADVRLSYKVNPAQRDEAALAADAMLDALRARGAKLTKPEERVIPAVRARAPEIALTGSLEDKLVITMGQKGCPPTDPKHTRVLGLFRTLRSTPLSAT